jgi:hypothetical protein
MEISPSLFPILNHVGDFYYSRPTHCPRYFQFKKAKVSHDTYPASLDEALEGMHLMWADLFNGSAVPRHQSNIIQGKNVNVAIQMEGKFPVYYRAIFTEEELKGVRPRSALVLRNANAHIYVSKYDVLYAGVIAHIAQMETNIKYFSPAPIASTKPFINVVTIHTSDSGKIFKGDIYTGYDVNDIIGAIDKVLSYGNILAPAPAHGGVCTKCPYHQKCFNILRSGTTSMSDVITYEDRL